MHKPEVRNKKGRSSYRLFFGMSLAVICVMLLFGGISVASAAAPTITEHWNWQTRDGSTSFTMELKHLNVFKVTSDQEIDTWHWYVDGIGQDNNDHRFVWRAGPEDKDYIIKVKGTNAQGTTNTITWNVHIPALGFGDISGTLTDKDTGLPIQGVTITGGTHTTATNGNGNYTLTNLKEDGYIFTVSKDGYNHQTKYIGAVSDETTTQDFKLVPYTPATITYDGNKIVISGGTATLTDINNDPDIDSSHLEQLSSKEWLLKVPIQVQGTGIFHVNDTDCEWLKLLSLNDGNEAYIKNYGGTFEIKNTKITSWDTNTNAPAPKTDNTRAYIISQVYAGPGNMNIYNSNASYLGAGGNPWCCLGISWVNGCKDFEIINSTFDNNYFGITAHAPENAIIKDCTVKSSKSRGMRFYVAAVNCTFDNNTLIDCANHGIHIANEGSHNNTVIYNTIHGAAGGIGLNIGAHHNYIAHNYLHHTHPHGAVDCHTNVHYNTVEYNVFHDIGMGVIGSHAVYIHDVGSSYNKARHNIMWNIQSDSIDVSEDDVNNNIIFDNIIGENSGPLAISGGNSNTVESNTVHSSASIWVGYGAHTTFSYNNTLISNNAVEYIFRNLNTEEIRVNTLRNPINSAITVQILDDKDRANIEFTDGRTFKLDGDAGGHTSVALTEVGIYTIEVEGGDTTPPTASNGQPGGTISDNTPTLSVESDEPATCKGSIDKDETYEDMDFTFTGTDTSHSYDVSTPLSDGNHTVYVRCQDTAGNIATSSYSWGFTVETPTPDTTPPTTTSVITPAPNEAGWNNVIPVVVTFFRNDNGGSGVSYTHYSKTSEVGPWTTVNIATAMGPDAENVTDIGEDKFNVTVSDEGVTTIWYYTVNNNATSEPIKNVTVKIDTTPPASISDLKNTTGTTWINWTWNDPPDNDFNHTMVYLDGIFKTNTSNPYYNATGLNPDTSYEIGTHTVDTYGNVNTTWVNQTTKTVNNLIPRYDVNEDGTVDILDTTIVGQHFGETTSPPYPRYDVNEDGTVDILDTTIVGQHFGEIMR